MRRLPVLCLALGLAAPAQAGVPTRLGAELTIGDAPAQTVVLPGDRVAAVLIGETDRVVAWRDAGDYTAVPSQIRPTIDAARSLAAAGTDEEPVLLIGGDALALLPYDTLDTPATPGVATTIDLPGDDGSLAGLIWSAAHDTAYGIDDVVPRLHAFALADGTAYDAVDLPFTPTDLALVDGELIVIIGEQDGAPRMAGLSLDGTGVPGELIDVDLSTLVDGGVHAIAGDGAGTGWIVASNGDDRLLVEITRAGARSEPRGCSVVEGTSGGFQFSSLQCELPQAASSIAYGVGLDGDDDTLHVYVGGGATVQRVDVAPGSSYALETLGFAPTGSTGDLALSSQTDAYLYVAQPGTGLLGVVAPGPWLTLSADDPNLSGNADSFTLTLTADLDNLQSCTFTVHVGGDFLGTGAAIEGATGIATNGAPVDVEISAIDLDDGTGRLFALCADDDGELGRASLTYYKGSLEAPELTALPGDGKVDLSFDGVDGDIDHYLVYFDTRDFGATGAADGSTEGGGVVSPITIDGASGTAAGDDDDADDDDAADDDDSAEGRSDARDASLSYSYELTDLLNDTAYYFAVSAVDTDGNEGPRSAVVEARPGATGGAAALAGDTYGCTCQNADPGPEAAGLAAALVALLGFGRRRFGTAQDTTRS